MIIFKPYYRRSSWPDHVRDSLLDFSERFNAAPILLRVNPTEFDTVTEAARALGIPVPIKPNGGTLKGELELGMKEAA